MRSFENPKPTTVSPENPPNVWERFAGPMVDLLVILINRILSFGEGKPNTQYRTGPDRRGHLGK